ncbi:MAG: DUF432 domain-containing protein [Fibrobacteria bacterium]|nr:DUF432 domain-containing protein [Fibrobacteria bacterium]
MTNTWKKHNIKDGFCYTIEAGFLKLWLYKTKNELHTFSEHKSSEPREFIWSEIDDRISDLEWVRCIISQSSDSIAFTPTLPDRALVVRPEFAMKIPAGVSKDFHIGIPIWLKIMSADDKLILEIPSEILSNTWFGPMETGELCYALKSSILSQDEPLKPFLHKAICPVQISNESGEDLVLQRICLQVKNLAVYQGQNRLWTNKIHISYQGNEKNSKIKIEGPPLNKTEEMQLLTEPKEVADQNFVRRTFSSFKEIVGV